MQTKTMKTPLLMALCALLMCCTGAEESSDDALAGASAAPQSIDFGAYLQRNTRRAGAAGILTTEGLGAGEVSLQAEGFGVIGYYTDNALYDKRTAIPNYMYNQQVTYDGVNFVWSYSPVKYWPNESLTDHLSFFAYAPFTDVNLLTGIVTGDDTKGIGALTRPNESGDPWVRYYMTFTPSEQVDLCWAPPHKDLVKPAAGSRVNFLFKHALSWLNIQIMADVDDHVALDDKTRIWVRQVSFEGFDQSGQLSLASTDSPVWYDVLGGTRIGYNPVTVYDGRRDGREGAFASTIEEPQGLNGQLIQSEAYVTSPSFTITPTGVTNVAQNLFDSATPTDPVYVIPTGEPLRVTIIYDVETYDEQLQSQYLSDGVTHGRTIENNITATVTTGGSTPLVLAAGQKYTVTLSLGMNSVKTSASVAAWGGNTDGEGDLPDDPSDHTDVSVEGSTTITNWNNGGTTNGDVGF